MEKSSAKFIGTIVLLLSGIVCADTITIDFENVSDLTYVPGYLTKFGSITQSTDVPSASTGAYSANFTWISDSAAAGQYAWMVKTYNQDMDFSEATFSFWHKRMNRSSTVGVALYDDGNLVAAWNWSIYTSWAKYSVEIGVTTPTSTGLGSIESVDEIRFLNQWNAGGTSGSACSILFDDFVATNVAVPEPLTMCILFCGGALAAYHRRKKC